MSVHHRQHLIKKNICESIYPVFCLYLHLQNKTRINKVGELIVTSEVSRSQQRNLDDCLQKISEIISEASQRPPEPSAEDLALRAKRCI